MSKLELFKDLIPFTGSSNATNSQTPTVGGGNFMWHGMTAYQWHHQSIGDIERTIRDLEGLMKAKEKMKELIKSMIADFDWSHMYSDDIKPSRRQEERDKEFNACIALCPQDIKEYAYREFVTEYLRCSPNGKSPISYEDFIKGIKV